MPSQSDLLIRYAVTDFTFDDLRDSVARHDAANQRVIPRTRMVETARDRFTKESDKASRDKQINRTDYTDRPASFNEAGTQVQDRRTHVGVAVTTTVITSSQLFYEQHQHKPGETPPTKAPPGGHGHK